MKFVQNVKKRDLFKLHINLFVFIRDFTVLQKKTAITILLKRFKDSTLLSEVLRKKSLFVLKWFENFKSKIAVMKYSENSL